MEDLSNQTFYVGKWQVNAAINSISFEKQTQQLPPKVMAALVLLAEYAGEAVARELLISKLWPTQLVTDSSLYQTIAILRKSLGDRDGNRNYIEKISGKGYRLIAEVTQKKQTVSLPKRYNSSFLVSAFLVMTLLGGVLYYIVNHNTKSFVLNEAEEVKSILPISARQIKSLVVMPFQNQQNQAETLALAGGLADALMTQLLNVKNLHIIKGQYTDSIDDIYSSSPTAEAYLLGRIQQENDQLRVNLQLQLSSDQSIIWAKEFIGNENDLFAFQDQIIKALLALFDKQKVSLSFNSQQISPKAFNAYLLGRFHWTQHQSHNLIKAELIFESVIKNAPNFALAYVGLCDTYLYNFVYRDWLFDKALIIGQQGELEQSVVLFRKALDSAPNYAMAHMWFGNVLQQLGYLNEAELQLQHAYRLSPQSPAIIRNLAYTLLNQAKIVSARKVYLSALKLESVYTYRAVEELDFLSLNIDRAVAYVKWSRSNPGLNQNPNHLINLSLIHLALGDKMESKALMMRAEQQSVDVQWLLFAKAVIAEQENKLKVTEELLLDRMQLQLNEQPYILPYINLLYRTGRHSEALKLAEQQFATEELSKIGIDDANIYSMMNYSNILNATGDTTKANTIAIKINTYLLNNLDYNNINHLEWIASHGQQSLAESKAHKMMLNGWLPNYYGELYSRTRMRKLLQETELKKKKSLISC